ncbi:hypothetical protein [Sphingomonas sp.]|uniref:hypothetical protein n=1 Tax=Sphingomonas sp. TaxID=28214 RepID=UPI003B3A9922
MAILTWPTCAFLTSVEWTPPDPDTQASRSEWTKREQIAILSLSGRWMAKVSIEPKMSEDAALDLEAFRVELKGRVNSFRMPATLRPQFPIPRAVSVSGGGGYALIVSGPAGMTLKRGHKLTVADQLLMNMDTATLNGSGLATLRLSNPLRNSAINGLAVEVVNPTCLVKLANPGAGWTGSYPDRIDFAQFDVEESF